MRKIVLIMLVFAGFALANEKDHIAGAELIKGILNESVELYKQGKAGEAKAKSDSVYFQHFESMEGDISINLGRKAYKMERKFKNLSKMYKDKEDIKRVQALVDGLIFDLDEVAPIIQSGFRLVAEKTNDGKSDEEIDSLYAQNQQKRQAEAEAIFAALGLSENAPNSAQNAGNEGEKGANSVNSANLNENSASKNATNSTNSASANDNGANSANLANENANSSNQNAENSANTNSANEQNSQSTMFDLQSAYGINPKLQYLIDNISFKFSLSASEFKHGQIQAAKDALNSALFDDYRNTQAEVVVNQYTSKGLNRKIQRGIRAMLVRLDDANLTEKELRNELEAVEELVTDAFSQIPEEQISRIQVAGFDENENAGRDYSKVADEIKLALDNVLNDYEGFNQGSINALQSVYLDIFEASGMENKIGAVDSAVKLKIEAQFSQGVALIKASAPKEELKASFDTLNALVASMLDKIQDSSPVSLFIWAFGIILREGLEALIIVVAIVSYLIQSGNKNRLNIVYSSLLTGVVLSFATAFLVSWVFKQNAAQSRELIEGICMLVAVVLLFYVGFWLLSNALNKKWSNFIKGQTIEAISKNSATTLWWSVFLAVYREGAETVLFYQALFFDAKTSTDYSAVFAGLGVGLFIIIALYFLLKAGAVRIPVKQFFYITSYIIFYMVFVFTGKGVAELIEGKFITPTLLPVKFESIAWLGLHPYYETLVPQLLVLILLVAGIFITHKFTLKGAK